MIYFFQSAISVSFRKAEITTVRGANLSKYREILAGTAEFDRHGSQGYERAVSRRNFVLLNPTVSAPALAPDSPQDAEVTVLLALA